MKLTDHDRRNRRVNRATNALRSLLLSDVEQLGLFDLEHVRGTVLRLERLIKPAAKVGAK